MTDKSATERLREMLDECGIKHFDYSKGGWTQTQWESPDGNRHFTYETYDNPAKTAKLVISWFPTPEQAIAATLGSEFNPDGLPVGLAISDDGNLLNWRGENYVKQSTLGSGTLTAEQVRGIIERNSKSTVTRHMLSDAAYMAIADELNATLGGGECKWVWVESWTDTADGRECDYAHWMPDCGCWSEGDFACMERDYELVIADWIPQRLPCEKWTEGDA